MTGQAKEFDRAILHTSTPSFASDVKVAEAMKAVNPNLKVGLIGAKAAEAVGRNPGAFGKVLTLSMIAMALAESIAIYALIRAFQGF